MKVKLTFIWILISSLSFFSCKQKAPDQIESEIPEFANPEKFIGEHKAQIMILGTFHFANPGLDSYKPQYEVDIFSDARQQELEEVLDALMKFEPTKVMVEVPRVSGQSVLNDRYVKFLKGEFDITTRHSETYQLGFKLAQRAGLTTIHGIDEKLEWYGANLDWENFDPETYLKSMNQYQKSNRYNHEKFFAWKDSIKMQQSLLEHLKLVNSPSILLRDHQVYLTNVALGGAGDNYYGSDSVGRWFGRNLRIYANIYDLTNFNESDRIVIIYGSGHVWTLRQLLMDSPDYEYVEVTEHLNQN